MTANRPALQRWGKQPVVVIPAAIVKAKISPAAMRLWIALATFVNNDRHCWPSRKKLVEMLPEGTVADTVKKARGELENAGLLRMVRRFRDDGSETSPDYELFYPTEDGGGEMAPEGEDQTTTGEGGQMTTGEGRPNDAPNLTTTEPKKKEAVVSVWEHWLGSTGRSEKRTKFDRKRRALIERALQDYPLDDVVAAVTNWKLSAFHRGENDRGKVFNDLGLLLRNAEKIEYFRDLVAEPEPEPEPEPTNVMRDENGKITHRHSMGSGWVEVA